MSESSSALYEWLVTSVQQMHLTESGPVVHWLEDLRLMTDTECMCVLQGKSLSKDATDVVFTAGKSTKDSIESIRGRAHVISSEFSKLFRRLEKERWKQVKTGGLRISCKIRSLLHECNNCIIDPPQALSVHQKKLMGECAKFAKHVETRLEVNGHKPDAIAMVQLLTSLGQSFSLLIDMALGCLVKKIVSNLELGESPYSIQSTLDTLVSLGLEGEHMCYLIAREGGLHKMFELCKLEDHQYCHGLALRAVATISCVPESIEELEQAGGVECLTNILGDPTVPENIRSEAAGVVAQITSPCLDHYQHLAGFIENMDDLIRTLTVLCVESSDHDVFLLGSAALANITFMDPMACDFLQQYNTARVLIEASLLGKAESVFARDQVVTVLANISALESCCNEITESHGVELLVQFLQECPPKSGSKAETAASERIQQKAAIAITRISRDLQAAKIVVALQGVPRLVHLCKDPKERNHSDAVLVACLAALRKISGFCGCEEVQSEDIKQLISPKLMDSYLYCSNMEESIV